MSVQLSVAVRNARLDAIETTIGTGAILTIRTGAQPASCATANSADNGGHTVTAGTGYTVDASVNFDSSTSKWVHIAWETGNAAVSPAATTTVNTTVSGTCNSGTNGTHIIGIEIAVATAATPRPIRSLIVTPGAVNRAASWFSGVNMGFDLDGVLVAYRRRREYLRAWLRLLPRRGALGWLDRINGKQFLDDLLEERDRVYLLDTEILYVN